MAGETLREEVSEAAEEEVSAASEAEALEEAELVVAGNDTNGTMQ